jgi:hypothetical protein
MIHLVGTSVKKKNLIEEVLINPNLVKDISFERETVDDDNTKARITFFHPIIKQSPVECNIIVPSSNTKDLLKVSKEFLVKSNSCLIDMKNIRITNETKTKNFLIHTVDYREMEPEYVFNMIKKFAKNKTSVSLTI